MGVQNPGVKGAYASIAKITRPVISEVVPRKRLFKQIEQLSKKPLIWISGPPGCGKTTLVSSYLDAEKIPCIWYQVDAGDHDISTFFYYMGLAARKVATRKRKPLPLLTPEYMHGLPTFTRRYFEELFSRITPPFCLIFDNYHQIPSQSMFHTVIAETLDVTPAHCNVTVISRRTPPQQFIRYQANSAMGFINWDDIMFNGKEARDFIRARGVKGLSEETILQIHEKTQGWAAGLLLMTEAARLGKLDFQKIDQTPPKEVFSYFANEVFERIEKEIQRLLLETAFLPKVTGQMARELSGNVHAEKILSDLHLDNFFIQNHPLHQQVYQYHPLFRDFLLAKAQEVMSHEEIAETRMKGAKLLEKAGQIEEAFSIFKEEKSWDDCIRLILVNAQSFMEKGRMHTLQEWIQSIPEGIRENVPWLLYWLAACKQPFNPVESQVLFEKAFHIFEGLKDTAGTLLSWSGGVNSIIHAWDNLKQLDYWLDWFDAKMASGITFPSDEIEAVVGASMSSIFFWRKPDRPDIKRWVDRGIAIAQKTQNANIVMQIYPQAIMFLNSTGLFNDARNVFNSFKGISQSILVSPLIMITNKFAESQFYSASAITDDKSMLAVEDGLKAAQKYGIHVWDVGLYCQGVLSSLNLQDLQIAGNFIEKLDSTVDSRQRNAYAYYLYLKGWYCLLVGDVTDALMFGEKSLQITEETGSPTPEMCTRLGFIQILYSAGSYEKARKQLSIVDTINKRIKNPLFEYICNLTEAQFAMGNEDETSVKEYLHRAMELGRIHGYFTMVHFWRPSLLAKLCRKALDWEIEVEYVQELIRALKLIPDEPPYETENWPYPLKIYTLGRFSLLKEGKAVSFSGKVQHKPLTLLKAIVAFGGREVDQNQLIDALWPDAAGDVAYSSYKTAMHRLRKLIGREEAVQVAEGRVTLDPRLCWVDVWAFQRLSGRVEELWKAVREEKKTAYLVGLSEKAIALYKGDFLTGDTMEPWTVSMREKLKNRFIQIVVRLCEHFEGSEQWDKAALYCGKGLEIDDLAEEFYQRLMTCYTHLGRQTDALSVYTRCCKVLHAAMGIEPSPKTVAIYRAITADAKVQN